MNKVKIFAHRGASAYVPENTIPAFLMAMEQRADGIELDVQLTKDGVPVVVHDEFLDRVSGISKAVWEYTLEELKKIPVSCGSAKYTDVRIPTLEEVLKAVKPSEMEVNIELKTGIYWYPQIEELVLHAVKRERMEDRVIYSSFNHYSIQRLKELDANAETAYLFSDVILDVEKYAKNTGVEGIHPALYHVKMANFLKHYKRSGLAVRVWTVNDEDEIRNLVWKGVDAIITDCPDLAVQARTEALNYTE